MPTDWSAIACAITISRTDGYALPLIWIEVWVPPWSWHSGVFWLAPPLQSHAPAYCICVQSFVAGRSKMHAYWRSPLFVDHSRPLMGSQVSLLFGGHGVCLGSIDSSMCGSAPLKS